MDATRALACCVLALLLGPVAATGQTLQAQATFFAKSAAWEAGEQALSGPLIGLIQRRSLDEDAPATDHWFQLSAAQVRVDWDAAELRLETPAGWVTPAGASHGSSEHTNAVLVGHDSRNDRFAYLFPLDGATLRLSMPCGKAVLSNDLSVQAESTVDPTRPPISRDTSSALQLQPCQDSRMTISGGPFLVVLWEWDADLTSDQGQEVLWSGKAQGEVPADTRPYASRARQLFLTVSDGSFTLDAEPGWQPRVFMGSATLDHAARVRLTDARGTFASVQDAVDAEHLLLAGDMALRLAPAKDALLAEVLGGADGASVDGSFVPLAVAAQPSGSPLPVGTWLALGLVGAALAPVPVVLLRRRMFKARFDRHVGEAYELQNRMLYAKSLRLTRRLLAHETLDADVHYLHGCALLETGRPAEALRHLERSLELARRNLDDEELGSEICIHAARAAAGAYRADPQEGRRKQVLEYLRQAIQYDPLCQQELGRQADLSDFMLELAVLRVGSDPAWFTQP